MCKLCYVGYVIPNVMEQTKNNEPKKRTKYAKRHNTWFIRRCHHHYHHSSLCYHQKSPPGWKDKKNRKTYKKIKYKWEHLNWIFYPTRPMWTSLFVDDESICSHSVQYLNVIVLSSRLWWIGKLQLLMSMSCCGILFSFCIYLLLKVNIVEVRWSALYLTWLMALSRWVICHIDVQVIELEMQTMISWI